MEINLNDMIQEALNKSAQAAFERALGDYDVTQAMTEAVRREVVEGAIGEAVINASKNVDIVALTKI